MIQSWMGSFLQIPDKRRNGSYSYSLECWPVILAVKIAFFFSFFLLIKGVVAAIS